ncbi:hypothetical protein A2617_01105 [Candidatus Daviesbacteria bacterium RIFOXYD1_FULL_41_10]|uniref:Peptidase family M49 n=3 Tax=Bacteria candidate phyla TaxID=1783234 RepID=A0A0G0FHM3_9BACT|nr:MAG: Peptidase family M49 [Berkelbacteria bacterium GW2011_GWA1_36_9]KKS14003.1 MAG: Peptidase family M49 [Candidatus Daviesbacteria bacterium GW2011_GWB1_41_5]OGE71029.1 MAG: hypothetical protein A2617_01105 [Candidatus Daviesbacteria bacterium RIFOXYD1_FULL_41_10]
MKNQSDYIKIFDIETPYLAKEEKVVLDKLVDAAKLVSKVYAKQIQEGFYPADATRKEIEKAASGNPDILSPFTFVGRDEKGGLVAIPYHQKYHDLIVPVARKLNEAAESAVLPRDFQQALVIQAKALLSGEYHKAQMAWMKIKPYSLDIVIGPIERNEDNLFFTKRSYEAWVGILSKDVSERISLLKDTVFSARRQILVSEKVDFMDKVQFRAERVAVFAGMIANYSYTATTLPNDIDLLEKYGSETWIFLPSIRENFKNCQYPVFNAIFAPFFKNSFTKDTLHRGYLLIASFHEIARVLIRYRFAVDRMKEFYPVFNDAAVEALGVKMAGMLLLKDAISQKEMEAILVMFLIRLFDGFLEPEEKKIGFGPLILGNTILMNSLISSGALKITREGISWPNFTKMFIAVSNIADTLEKILAEGTYKDAQDYMNKHSSTAVFKHFIPSLKTLRC